MVTQPYLAAGEVAGDSVRDVCRGVQCLPSIILKHADWCFRARCTRGRRVPCRAATYQTIPGMLVEMYKVPIRVVRIRLACTKLLHDAVDLVQADEGGVLAGGRTHAILCLFRAILVEYVRR